MHLDERISRRLFVAGGTAAVVAFTQSLQAQEGKSTSGAGATVSSAIRSAPLAMQFTGTTAAECRQWQEKFRARLKELLGPHDPPASWKTTVRGSAILDGFRRDDLLLEADGCLPLPVYLLVPTAAGPNRRAGVIALHGHGEHGHHPIAGRDDLPGVELAIASSNYDYGRQLARRGYVVACPCLLPFGERLGNKEAFGKLDPCSDVFVRMLALGRVLIAENLRSALWAMKLLESQGEVDAERLACVGLSYGGRMTMLTAAIEPRFKAAAISGALNVMQERLAQPYSCGAQIIPGLLQFGDVPEIGSLIAPRPAVWETGTRDSLIKQPWAENALSKMRRAYEAFGAADRLILDRFEGGHQWHGEVAYGVLAKMS
jgi:dienelactone hydrolase